MVNAFLVEVQQDMEFEDCPSMKQMYDKFQFIVYKLTNRRSYLL